MVYSRRKTLVVDEKRGKKRGRGDQYKKATTNLNCNEWVRSCGRGEPEQQFGKRVIRV